MCKYLQMFEANGDSYEASNMERVRGVIAGTAWVATRT